MEVEHRFAKWDLAQADLAWENLHQYHHEPPSAPSMPALIAAMIIAVRYSFYHCKINIDFFSEWCLFYKAVSIGREADELALFQILNCVLDF